MKKYSVGSALIIAIFSLLFAQCQKDKYTAECIVPAIVPYTPYSDPVWHPDGQQMGFNHTPQTGVYASGKPPCTWYMNSVNRDSSGFYLMNKDGTGFRRITNFRLGPPAWSPDGHWIAFSIPPNIYKMRFDGNTFDTAHIIQLTDSAANFYPSWTTNSDTIYYDSNGGTNGQGYCVWKMAADGSGKSGFPNTGRVPFVGSNDLVYFERGILGQPEIFSMKKDGSNLTQETFDGKHGLRRNPKFKLGKLFYWDAGIFTTPVGQYLPQKICLAAETYDISDGGEILYVNINYPITDKRNCTIWVMNNDGSNNRQLTFNNF